MTTTAWISIAAIVLANGGALFAFAVRYGSRQQKIEDALSSGKKTFDRIEAALAKYTGIEDKRHNYLDQVVGKIHRGLVKVAASLNIDLRE